jgi:hypothetical protein
MASADLVESVPTGTSKVVKVTDNPNFRFGSGLMFKFYRLRVFKMLAKQYQSSSVVATSSSWKRLLDLSMMLFVLSVAWSKRGIFSK